MPGPTLLQIKRTSVTGRQATIGTLPDPGSVSMNMTDGILYGSNGSVIFEIGANNTQVAVTNSSAGANTLILPGSIRINSLDVASPEYMYLHSICGGLM